MKSIREISALFAGVFHRKFRVKMTQKTMFRIAGTCILILFFVGLAHRYVADKIVVDIHHRGPMSRFKQHTAPTGKNHNVNVELDKKSGTNVVVNNNTNMAEAQSYIVSSRTIKAKVTEDKPKPVAVQNFTLQSPFFDKNKSTNILDLIGDMELNDIEDNVRRMTSSVENTLMITVATSRTLQDIPLGDSVFRHCTNLDEDMRCSYHKFNYSVYNDSYAFLVHGAHLSKDDIIPNYRMPDQKWIYFNTEPPVRTWNDFRLNQTFWNNFNITATYSSDSKLLFTMNNFVCKRNHYYKPAGINYASRKVGKRPVLWMGTNCKQNSRTIIYHSYREAYINELKKHIPVHTDTSCGTGFQCGQYPDARDKCIQFVMSRYKFYLAFEDVFCGDFYSQKVSKSMGVDVIAVVMGMADYTNVLTPGTFLNVRDYQSPKELADYLKYLDANDTAYNEYIERKHMVTCTTKARWSFHCKLCRYLHTETTRVQTVPDIREFWGIQQKCHSPQEFFKGIADTILPKIERKSTKDVKT